MSQIINKHFTYVREQHFRLINILIKIILFCVVVVVVASVAVVAVVVETNENMVDMFHVEPIH